MRVGIVGLPNVGKSTVFNSLTRAGAEALNYPFTTIDPNLGVAPVPDGRLNALAGVMSSKRVVPATVDFVDIAGLVRGASAGEGLGNQFLGHIRECDAIAHVVRCFEEENVVHVHGGVDPEGDIETIDTELLLADLAAVERRLERVGRAAKGGDARLKAEATGLERLRDHLSDGSPARAFPSSGALAEAMGTLITAKPTLYVANVDEESVADGNRYSSQVEKLRGAGGRRGGPYLSEAGGRGRRALRGGGRRVPGHARGKDDGLSGVRAVGVPAARAPHLLYLGREGEQGLDRPRGLHGATGRRTYPHGHGTRVYRGRGRGLGRHSGGRLLGQGKGRG